VGSSGIRKGENNYTLNRRPCLLILRMALAKSGVLRGLRGAASGLNTPIIIRILGRQSQVSFVTLVRGHFVTRCCTES
jgi:hypothetical protein